MNTKEMTESEWLAAAREHQRLVEHWSKPYRYRRRKGMSHPVNDFLFVYYRYSSMKLEKWHPGIQVRLKNAARHTKRFPQSRYTPDGNDAFCDPAKIQPKERERLRWTADLLRQTAARKPNFSCLGLHEWAMVYKGKEVRHEATTALRLPQSEIDALVESRPITCTHYDAFRFFAIDAQPLNKVHPTLEGRPDHEQPACIHANMDLYKWAFKSMPWVGSDLLFRCFKLAIKARTIDMRASPYDLSEYGEFTPILIETPEGRVEYEASQREIAEEAIPLRAELADKIELILSI